MTKLQRVIDTAVIIVIAVAVVVMCSGCSGLNVQWALTAAYNTPAFTTATMTPGVPAPPVQAASAAK